MDFMAEAARLALEGVRGGRGGPFGAVVVRGDAIVGRGCNRVLETNDPTAHAEIEAIRDASRALRAFHLVGCEIWTTCEPCPMCLAAIHWARLDRVHYALPRADAARIGFADAKIERPWIPLVRVPSAGAEEAFALWESLPGRKVY